MPIFRSLSRWARAGVLSFALSAQDPAELQAALAKAQREARKRGVLAGESASKQQVFGKRNAQPNEPSERSFTAWTPRHLKIVQAQAEVGDLRLVADLCTAILGDDRMQRVLDTRVRSLLGLPLTFEEGSGRRRKKAAKAAEVDDDWAEIFPETEELRLFIWALLLGVGLGQLLFWENVRGKRVVRYRNGRLCPALKTWNPRYLREDKEKKRWVLRTETGEIVIEPDDPEWLLVFPYGDTTPAMWGLWRGLARLLLLKSAALDDWGNASEDHGRAIKSVEPPVPSPHEGGATVGTGSTPAERQQIADEVDQLVAGGVIAMPPGYKLELIEAKANTWQMFRQQIELVNTSAAITVLGQNLSTEVSGGSLAAAQAHGQVRIDLRRCDAEVESTTGHRALEPWAELNFGSRSAAPWPKRQTEPPEDKAALAKMFRDVADGVKTFKDAGKDVADDQIEERFGFVVTTSEPEDEDEEPAEPEAPPAAAA